MSLMKAYMTQEIPPNGGFIISGYFESGTIYAIYEITAYKNLKDVYKTAEGLVFRTDGNRTHILVEPATYSKKFLDPVNRDSDKSIPYRFNDLTIFTSSRHEKIMVGKEPVMLHTNFTVLQKEADYFTFIFYPTEDVYVAMKKFMADSLYNDCNLSKRDCTNASEAVLETVKKFTIWQL